ncbi:MAG: PIN domain-containing protein [archaeon]|jgi:predicted nucleic acid-binding protein
MKQRFYLDTAIWRDYFEDRHDNLRPLREFAFGFLKNCEKHNCEILYSPLVKRELLAHYSEERVQQVFSSFLGMLREVKVCSEHLNEAKRIRQNVSDSHTADIIHAVLARDNRATLITRDKHFEGLIGIVQVLKPEEVTFY